MRIGDDVGRFVGSNEVRPMAGETKLATEQEARAVAEAAREQEWEKRSFLRRLFEGDYAPDLLHPLPDEDAADEEQLEIHLLSHALTLRASDARKRRVAKSAEGPDGPVQVTAPMPGRVVKLLAPEGTAVTRGDGIIVLEAMKMENELKAPRDGVVASVRVEEGQGVEGGALLATIE